MRIFLNLSATFHQARSLKEDLKDEREIAAIQSLEIVSLKKLVKKQQDNSFNAPKNHS